ncbi:acylphosphatase [Reichenbachiella versicolor]|uniref:acylphosphatase n=1 Tax=Reichenbachiella versicolor TaxID=1821036 RepID=UPI000D6DE0B6|nr:acylphosphatase [Reichenbachiella versicolor]
MKAGRSLIIKGKVQGVFYRASTIAQAQKLGLNGWVRNLSNGDVEVKMYGETEKLDDLTVWCKVGPEMARVEEVNMEEIPFEKISGFEVKYD